MKKTKQTSNRCRVCSNQQTHTNTQYQVDHRVLNVIFPSQQLHRGHECNQRFWKLLFEVVSQVWINLMTQIDSLTHFLSRNVYNDVLCINGSSATPFKICQIWQFTKTVLSFLNLRFHAIQTHTNQINIIKSVFHTHNNIPKIPITTHPHPHPHPHNIPIPHTISHNYKYCCGWCRCGCRRRCRRRCCF